MATIQNRTDTQQIMRDLVAQRARLAPGVSSVAQQLFSRATDKMNHANAAPRVDYAVEAAALRATTDFLSHSEQDV